MAMLTLPGRGGAVTSADWGRKGSSRCLAWRLGLGRESEREEYRRGEAAPLWSWRRRWREGGGESRRKVFIPDFSPPSPFKKGKLIYFTEKLERDLLNKRRKIL
jgi:hypothetical protein